MKDQPKKKTANRRTPSRNGPPMQRCRQTPEMEDCFARNKIGNCKALEDTNYPCGKCPFYKPREVLEAEVRRSRRRLIAIGRMDLIARYECRK